MKSHRVLKTILIILLIILISIISLVGLYMQEKNAMVNQVKNYRLGMDLEGYRVLAFAVDNSTETIYYDKDGNVVEEEVEGGKTEKIPANSEDALTTENYLLTKKIYETRLNDIGVAEYFIRQDEENGKIIIQLPEDGDTDLVAQTLYTIGAFSVEDEEGNVLLDNSNIKETRVGYTTLTGGTTVYLNIELNKDSVEKLKEITNTYVTSTDEEGNDTSKKVTLKIDDNELISTSFQEEIPNGIISLSLGTSTNATDINTYLQEASNIAIILNSGKLPVAYTLETNRYVKSDITARDIVTAAVITAIVVIITLIVLSIIYKKNGLLVAISYIGYISILLLALRYANVIITMEGLFAILIALVINYVFSIYLLKAIKKLDERIEISKVYNKTTLAMILILVPVIIIGIVLCFVNWLTMYSFGAIIFWSILLMLVYNMIVTRTLLLLSSKK